MRCVFVIVLSFLYMNQHVLAQDQHDAEQMIKSKLDAVFLVLQKKDLSEQEKSSKIDEIVSPMFDFPRMAMLSLGRRYWPGLDKEEQGRFTALFIKRMKDAYCGKLMLYTDEEVVYEASVQTAKKIRIPTYLISKDNRISILYKFYKAKGGWKIYDVEIDGVSVIKTYRSQFSQVLQNGTIDDLLLKLNEPVDS